MIVLLEDILPLASDYRFVLVSITSMRCQKAKVDDAVASERPLECKVISYFLKGKVSVEHDL